MSLTPALATTPALGSLRLQAAVVRALLDEVEERPLANGTADELIEQLAEELDRLGRDALLAAKAIARCRSVARPHVGSESEGDRIPHWLPIVSF